MKTVDVIVTGGRDYRDQAMVDDVLNSFNISLLIQGGAQGADQLALEYAKEKEIAYFTYEADWNKHGKAAGPIRNREMLLANLDAIVVAFPGGLGTENCIKQALQLNMIVFKVL